MMYGQMTAGSWIYIGTQGILQGTYATFTEVANQHFGGTLAGTITLTGGLGGMGGAQPLAVTGNGGAALCIEVDPWRAQRRLEHGYLDEIADSLDDGIARVEAAKRDRRALSVAVVANCADVLPELVTRGWTPTSSPTRPRPTTRSTATCRTGMSLEEALELRPAKPAEYVERSPESMAVHCRAMVDLFARAGAVVFDYGNGLRGQAQDAGLRRRVRLPGLRARLRPAAVRPRRRPVPLGLPVRRSAADLAATDQAVLDAFPDDDQLQRWVRFAGREGARGRGCRPGSAGSATASGTWPGPGVQRPGRPRRVSAPVVIGRDHLDAGSVASPERETEGMRDGTDAIADWPILNALVNTASGASWVSVHHGGGVGIGKSIHAGVVVVADGSAPAYEKVSGCSPTTPAPGCCGTPTRATRSPSGPPARSASGSRCSTAPTPPPGSRLTDAAEVGQPVFWRAR